MWQRIQTLYFAVAVGLLSALVFGYVFDDVKYISKLPYAVLLIGAYAGNIVSLLAFKKRSLQLRLAGVATVFLLGLQVWLAVDYFSLPDAVFRFTAVFPLVAAFLDIQAIKGVYADELIVRSSSRLRAARNAEKRKKK